MSEYTPVIGLEVHAELQTHSKMFCGCPVVDSTQADPNTAVCEICTGMPGTLPVINRRAVEFGMRVAAALHCSIAPVSVFARKNYFYPDLPKGYQISQYELPLAENGWIAIQTDGGSKKIRIHRVHLEEDTGKLVHADGCSLVDFNRSGVPLLEIVSEPDMHSVEEAKAYAHALRSLVRYLGVNSGDMEKGVMRFEANISVRPIGIDQLGTRTEVKNLNSFRAMEHAIAYEVERQSALLDAGDEIMQQTMGWDEHSQETYSQRSKEEAHDYRYFPEPDLPPLQLDPGWIESIENTLPELPDEKMQRYVSELELSPYQASVIAQEPETARYFEAAVMADEAVSPSALANWFTGEFFSLINQTQSDIQSLTFPARHLTELVSLVEDKVVNQTTAKTVLAATFVTGESPRAYIDAHQLAQINDPVLLLELIHATLEQNPAQRQQYLAGKTSLEQWFFGQVMRAAKGKANPAVLKTLLSKALQELNDGRPLSG